MWINCKCPRKQIFIFRADWAVAIPIWFYLFTCGGRSTHLVLDVESDICMYVQRPRARYSHMLTREGPYFLCVAFLTVRASMSFECVDALLQFLK